MLYGKNVRTDLTLEAHELIKEKAARENASQGQGTPGVEVETAGDDEIKITRVRVTSPTGEVAIGKPMGSYITLEIPRLRDNDQVLYENTCKALATELVSILKLQEKSAILVVGLGKLECHSRRTWTKGCIQHDGHTAFARICSGAGGQGRQAGLRRLRPEFWALQALRTGEIIRGIVDRIKPDCIIAIDALASRKMERVNTTIQIADTGRSPPVRAWETKGWSCRRRRLASLFLLSEYPPSSTRPPWANDTIDLVLDSMIQQAPQGTDFYTMMKSIDRNEKYMMIQEVLKPYIGNLIVTP